MVTWKSWIPGYGDKDVRRKLRELDKAGIGIPMIIILMLQKSFELIVKEFDDNLPTPLWLTFMLTAALTFTGYVYDKSIREKAEKTKEKAKEQVEQ